MGRLIGAWAVALGLLVCPALARASPAPPRLSVTGASLFVPATGQSLFGLNSDAELPIASTTKIMTALVTLQHVRHLDEMFTQTDWRPSSVDSQIGLIPGERMSVHDLLLALLLPSADDAAEDLAYNVGGGSVRRFIGMMNAQARALDLRHTHYTTPIGLDTPGNYSSPSDLDRLAAYAVAHEPFIRRAVDLPHATLLTGRYRRYVTNTDDLVGRVPWIDGVKTGHTNDAGYVLVSSGRRNGLTLIGSVLGTVSEAARDANAVALLDWGFSHFRLVEPLRRGQRLTSLPVSDSSRRAGVIAGGSWTRVVERDQSVHVRLKLPDQLSGPLPRHAIVGQALVLVGGRVVRRVPALLERPLPAVSPVVQVGRFLIRPSTLVWLVVFAGLAAPLARVRRRGPRGLVRRHLEEG